MDESLFAGSFGGFVGSFMKESLVSSLHDSVLFVTPVW